MASFGKLAQSLILTGVLGLCASPPQANMRAPRALEFPPSSALQNPLPTAGLIVREESLSFALAPYPEAADIDDSHYGFATVNAIYTVEATHAGTYELAFVTPDATPTQILLNDFEINASAPTLSTQQGNSRYKTWESRFQLSLSQGRNVIAVTYRQPVSAHEWNLGYFRHSKWHSDIHYELWPLKEWQLAPNFRLNINVQIADDSGWLPRLFGRSRWQVSACESSPGQREEATCLDPISIEMPERRLLYHYGTGPDFPNHLHIRISE